MEPLSPIEFNETPQFIEEKQLVGTLMTGVPRSASFFMAGMTVVLMILSTLLFWWAPQSWADLMPAMKQAVVRDHQWWRIFTAVFIHADLEHLLSNMLMLGIFSFFIYGYFGFTIFPFVSLLLAAAVNFFTIQSYGPETSLLGASGLVYVLGGFWLAMYFFVQRQYPIIMRLIRVVGVALMMFAPTSFAPTTSYTAHGYGFCFGIIAATIYFYMKKKSIRDLEVYQSTFVQI